MYLLRLNNYKNLRIILTNKYLIIITKNGIIKFQTNFYNLYITNNNLYFDFSQYKNIDSNIKYYFLNKLYLQNLKITNSFLNYYLNYLNSFYNNLYYNNLPELLYCRRSSMNAIPHLNIKNYQHWFQ